MFEATPDRRVRIISQSYNRWKVQVLFSDQNISAAEVTQRLDDVKKELAEHFAVPDRMLEYSKLLGRHHTRNGLLVEMQIIRQEVPTGAPRLRPLPVKTPAGIIISDMRLEADLWPYDEFDRPLTQTAIEARLLIEGFDLQCVDWAVVNEALERMRATAEPVLRLEIGRGALPAVGHSSRLTYGIPPSQERLLNSAWIGVRPVAKGEFLAEVSPATSAFEWGKNVYGRDLEPRSGLQTRLESGEGTSLSLRGTRIISAREGLVLFERIGRDKRDRDAYDLVPLKLSVIVLPLTTVEPAERFDLDLREPAAITGGVPAGSRISSACALFIDGDVGEGAEVSCTGSIRITGGVRKARVASCQHVAIAGLLHESRAIAEFTCQADGGIISSQVRTSDLIAHDVRGSDVDAIRELSLSRMADEGKSASAIRINLRRFLESQQNAGREAIEELKQTFDRIADVFGPDIAAQTSSGSEQRMLLTWLRRQKMAGLGNYTHSEVEEFRQILEMVPLIREQLSAIGMELRDVTARLQEPPPEGQT